MKAAGLTFSDVQLTAAELQALARQAATSGDAALGERIYRRPELACVACHAIGGAGSKIGPDLTSIGASAPTDYIIEALLYPNAKIKEGYHSVVLTTKDGRELSGMIARETGTEVILRDAANQEVSVATQNIAKRTNAGSLMPAGLIDGLVPEERLDLIKFLSQLGRPGPYDAAQGGVARLWNLYLIVSRNQAIGIEPVIRGDPALADWIPTFSLVSGALPRDLITAPFPTFVNTRGLFAATRFESAKGGTVTFTLTGAATAAWLNGQLLKPGATFTATAKPGANVLVLQLDEKNLPAEIALRSADVTFLTN
jgi:putative heme-binding domain-containing protein